MNKTLEQIVAELKPRHKKVILHLKDGPKAIIGNLEHISTNQTMRDLQKYRIVARTIYANQSALELTLLGQKVLSLMHSQTLDKITAGLSECMRRSLQEFMAVPLPGSAYYSPPAGSSFDHKSTKSALLTKELIRRHPSIPEHKFGAYYLTSLGEQVLHCLHLQNK